MDTYPWIFRQVFSQFWKSNYEIYPKKLYVLYLLVSWLGTIVMLTMNIEIIPETFIAPDKCSEFKDILQCIISNNSLNESTKQAEKRILSQQQHLMAG